jgi:heat shock protein HtpX
MNYVRTAILLAGLTALFMAIGYLLGGPGGALIAFLVAAVMNLMSYWNADSIVLTLHGAHEVDERTTPELIALVHHLTRNAGLPMPRVYVMDNPQPNAFATGRNPAHAAVAVSSGLLNMLAREEIAGVIAHELAHIRNRDTLTMTITATIAGAISMLAQFGLFFGGGTRDNNNGAGVFATLLMVILAPIAAILVQMAISRTREYAADELGARISGAPEALASALAKISNAASMIENESAERAPATAHLFIVNPLTHRGMDNLFSTHPSTENRIAALRRLAQEMGQTRSRGPTQAGLSVPTQAGPWGPWGSRHSRGPWG